MTKKITFNDFNEILGLREWYLKIGIQDDKLPDWHLLYLDNLHCWNPDMQIDIWVDAYPLTFARKIDIYVKHKDQNPYESGVKHLQFVSL